MQAHKIILTKRNFMYSYYFWLYSAQTEKGWVIGLNPIECSRILGLWRRECSPCGEGGFPKGSYPTFTRISKKTTENSERLGRQARPGIEPGISRLPVLSAEPLCHWWGKTCHETLQFFLQGHKHQSFLIFLIILHNVFLNNDSLLAVDPIIIIIY